MRRLTAIAIGLWLLTASSAFAQSGPGWTFGYVPTVAQWQQAFTSKQDYLGAPPLLTTGGTMTGPLVTAASIAAAAGLNVQPGTAPTSPIDGDLWGTTSGIFARVNGVSYNLLTPSTPCAICAVTNADNQFTAIQTNKGATTTSPGWYAQLTGDAVPRVRVGLNAQDVASIGFGSGSVTRDAFIERAGPANLRFGGADSASPVAQTSSVQNVAAGTLNTAGANRTIAGSQGTGSGVGGDIIFQVAPAGGSGTTQNALTNSLVLKGSGAVQVVNSIAVAGCTIGSTVLCAGGNAVIDGTLAVQSNLATGFMVQNAGGITALQVDPSVGSLAAGLKITGAVTGGTVALAAIDSGSNTNVSIDAKGSGTVTINGTGTGAITLSRATTISAALTYGGVTLSNAVTGTGPMVLGTSPSLTTPTLGVAGGTSLALGGATIGANALAVTGSVLFNTALGVASGGTGQSSFTAHGVIVGNGTSGLGLVAGNVGNSSLPLLSQGASLDPAYAQLSLSAIASIATNTVLGNATSGSASPLALAVGTCSTSASALIWTTNTGFGCNTAIAAPVSALTGAGANVVAGLAIATGSVNGFARVIATGTITLATSAVSSGTCGTAGTSAATGTLTTDVIDIDFNGDPTATTGYTPSAMLTLVAYPTADTVNVKQCNVTGSTITPSAITLNWRVRR